MLLLNVFHMSGLALPGSTKTMQSSRAIGTSVGARETQIFGWAHERTDPRGSKHNTDLMSHAELSRVLCRDLSRRRHKTSDGSVSNRPGDDAASHIDEGEYVGIWIVVLGDAFAGGWFRA